MREMSLWRWAGRSSVQSWVYRWLTALPVSLAIAVLVVSGCAKPHYINVDRPVKPKFIPPGNIKEFYVHNFEGSAECTRDLQNELHAKAVNAGDWVPHIIGLPDLDGPLEVKGKVDLCSLRMGYGALNATMWLWHGGKQLYQEVVKEETNRPGASTEEVRATLADRVVRRFASIFVSGKKLEIREGRPRGESDPWWIAVNQSNWKLAITLLTERITADQKDAPSWYNRGLAYEGNRAFVEAAADYKKAVELERDERHVQALVRVETILEEMRAFEKVRAGRE